MLQPVRQRCTVPRMLLTLPGDCSSCQHQVRKCLPNMQHHSVQERIWHPGLHNGALVLTGCRGWPGTSFSGVCCCSIIARWETCIIGGILQHVVMRCQAPACATVASICKAACSPSSCFAAAVKLGCTHVPGCPAGAAPSPVSWVFRPDQVAPPCSTRGTPKLNHYILPDSLRSYSGQYARSRSLTPQPAQGEPSAGLQQRGREQPAAWALSPHAGASTALTASGQPNAAQPVGTQALLGAAGTPGAQYTDPSLGGQQQGSPHQSRESGLQQGALTLSGPAWAQQAQQPQGSHQQGSLHQSGGSEWQQNFEHQSTRSPQQHPRVAREQHRAGPQGQAGWSYSVEPPSSVWQNGRSHDPQQAPARSISAEHMSGSQGGAGSGQQAASTSLRATSAVQTPIDSQAAPWPAGSLAAGELPASPYTPAANPGSVTGPVRQGQPAASQGGGTGGHSSLATAAVTPPEAVLPSLPTRPAGSRGDLLAPLLPSMEDGRLHATVSGLRVALQQAQQTLDHTQQQVGHTLGTSQGAHRHCCLHVVLGLCRTTRLVCLHMAMLGLPAKPCA